MRHDHYVHLPELPELLKPLLKMLTRIHRQGEQIIMALEAVKAALAAANTKLDEIGTAQGETGTALTEIASDLDALIAKLAEGQPGSVEVQEATDAANALVTRLNDLGASATAQSQAAKDAAGKFTA
jgi:ABC-type transporter Mla subunit MlaD